MKISAAFKLTVLSPQIFGFIETPNVPSVNNELFAQTREVIGPC